MVLEQKAVGTRVYYIDRKEKLLFTKTELKKARTRYEQEYAKAVSRGEI